MTIAYIALGSNLNEPCRQLEDALQALAVLPQSRLLMQSSFIKANRSAHRINPIMSMPLLR
ncbi:conserved domain protein [Haemophilus pittmaniae HK 85]|uniref:Conserved domain protein n=1 Tax=Haemophilus pittmaniae HK 85 TaxID=1035188 RepID=F9Q785_9PAST|nr:conserved domain protein [Haemophilus pittmaniae HK 85]